jgi:hypothetical protein
MNVQFHIPFDSQWPVENLLNIPLLNVRKIRVFVELNRPIIVVFSHGYL